MKLYLVTRIDLQQVRAGVRSPDEYVANDSLYAALVAVLRDEGHSVHVDGRDHYFLPLTLAYKYPELYRVAKGILRVLRLDRIDHALLSRSVRVNARREGAHVIFTELNDRLRPRDLDRLRDAGIRTVEWFGRFPDMATPLVRMCANHYAQLWCPGEYREEFVKSGITQPEIHVIGNGYNAKHMYHEFDSNYSHDIVFIGGVGGVHSQRMSVLNALAERYDSFAFYGYGAKSPLAGAALRKSFRGWADQATMRRAYSSSRIALNLTFDGYDKIRWGSNERLFAIPACRGAAQFASYLANNDVFFNSRELVQFSSLDALLGEIDFYLAHERERRALVEAAYLRNADYTYYRRIRDALPLLTSRPKPIYQASCVG